ncbi:MAG: FHA domain-containing protein [Woeseiaceae bacterium]|nr:FHA domain-containing protein [Woeseiaceae bacterium]
MANKKNKINELVSDEDPTAELEAITFRQDQPVRDRQLRETDENTHDFEGSKSDDARTIGKLQYDIEQLRAKWLGLETEIRAREEVSDSLNAEISGLRDDVARKDKLLRTRDSKIKALKAEIRDREEHYRSMAADLGAELEAARKALREMGGPVDAESPSPEEATDEAQLERSEAYADVLRRKLQDLISLHDTVQSERDNLFASLTRARDENHDLNERLTAGQEHREQLEADLAGIADKHAEEIRTLRFELGEAQETVAQTEVLNSQLASDLVDTRSFKEELERMICENDERSQSRIEELERELNRANHLANDYEQKLEARSDAINVLLKELARKSEQAASIDDIGEVISDIDERISEQFEEVEEDIKIQARAPERTTRMLVGKIGRKLLRFPLFKDRLTIGRTSDNDIQLNAPYISRRHAVVQTDGDATRVIDWGSKNGVYVNSSRVTEHFLCNGDIVTIGNAHFRYEERPKRET